MRRGITASTFDLFHAGHVAMLEEAKSKCSYLIVAIQTDPTVDRPEKNKPVQSIVERQIQVRGCKYVDEIIVYTTEKDLEDILKTFPIDVRILGEEYQDKNFTGKDICLQRGIELYFNKRDHGFSSSGLRRRVYEEENIKRQQLSEKLAIL
jgi:glycerol-3-phosphate cytidylyltransferase